MEQRTASQRGTAIGSSAFHLDHGICGDPEQASSITPNPKPTQRLPITLKAIGGISELVVAVDLLQSGYDVYRSMTVGGLCDLVAVHRASGSMTRVEVKSAQRAANGRATHGSIRANKFDVLARVFSDGSIEYEPDLLSKEPRYGQEIQANDETQAGMQVMPSKSAKQHRFMEAAAHNPGFAKKAGISQSVAQEFVAADKGKALTGKVGKSRKK